MKSIHEQYQMLCTLYNFLLRVLRRFIQNQGFLLSGAIAYYTLLSIVPFSIIAITVLTNFVGEQQLLVTLSLYLEMLIPGYAETLTEQVQVFMKNRKVISFIGFLGMLFFSSMAFSMLQSALSAIFSNKIRLKQRNVIISAIIPYLYILFIGLAITLVSIVVGAIEFLENSDKAVFGWCLCIGGASGVALYVFGIAGEVAMFASLYLVLPSVRVKVRHALIGGITATVLWELSRRVLIWYYTNISMVNVIYGSITIPVVALLCIEVAALIVLFGAQVIAELELRHIEKQA